MTKPTYSKMIMLLALQIMAIAAVMMLVSYATDYLQISGFFGDHIALERTETTEKGGYIWGYRHVVYFWMGFLLFLLSIVRLCIWAFNYSETVD